MIALRLRQMSQDHHNFYSAQEAQKMSKKTVLFSKDTEVKYPQASVCVGLAPTHRTPSDAFPMRISQLLLTDEGDVEFKEGKPIVDRVLVERVTPPGKKTACGFESIMPSRVWQYSLMFAGTAYAYGLSVRGRVYAAALAANYANSDSQLEALFSTGWTLLVEFDTTRGMPKTMGGENSAWIVPMAVLRDHSLSVAQMCQLVDAHTVQVQTDDAAPVASEFAPISFDLG